MSNVEGARAQGHHYGTTQPGVTPKHLAKESATRFTAVDEQAVFAAGFKAAANK